MASLPIDDDRFDIPSAARLAIMAGLRVVAPKEDGTKRPETELVDGEWTWKHWQTTPPSREQLRRWYGPKHGIGIITGSASGNVELFEFDDGETWSLFLEAADGAGLTELVERIQRGYLEETPGGGVHWLYRCDEIGGNEKLARYQVEVDGRREIHPLIETRGEGGYAVLAPSHGPVHATGRPYRILSGGVATIVTITPEERAALFQLARTFDRLPKEEFRFEGEPTTGSVSGRPGDDFNQRATWDEVLEPHGWTKVHQHGDITRWRRPNKDYGVSATTNWQGSDLLYVFSTSTPFEAERGYSKFRAYAILTHGGDFKAAARELAGKGYGQPKRARLKVVPPLDDLEAGDSPAASVRRFKLTDSGNAERLVHRYGDVIRFNWRRDAWFIWDGKRWKEDQVGEIEQLAKATCRRIPEEAEGVDGDLYKKIMDWAGKSEDAGKRRSMVRLAQSEPGIPVLPSELDVDPWLLNVVNGTIDLRSGTLRPHDKADLITRLIDVPYDPDATCPTFETFLLEIMNGDRELVGYVQRLFGYSLTGITREQIMIIAYGTGANGKTTLLSTFRELLSDYAREADAESFMDRKNAGIREDIADLDGARFVTASETSDGKRLSEALVKKMTGGERLRARRLYENGYEFVPHFKPWLATNHKPRIQGTEHAIWRRIKLLPFTVTITDDRKDPDLPEKLKAEYPGILAWAVRGCLDWQQHGLEAPAAVVEATESYRKDQDTVARWLEDECELGPTWSAKAADLHASHKRWCEANGERWLSPRKLGERLAERGLESFKGTGGVRTWLGVKLQSTPGQSTLSGVSGASGVTSTKAAYVNTDSQTSMKVAPLTPLTPLDENDDGGDDEPDF